MSLEAFGQKLRKLRMGSGLTQAGLARQFPISPGIISVWERAYQHRGRRWVPDRQAVLRLVEIFASQLSSEEAQSWAVLAGYQLGQAELEKIFPAQSTQSLPHLLSPLDFQTNFERLEMLPDQRLFGARKARQQLRLILEQAEGPWLIAIDGIGGIGKTSLANALVREIMPGGRFYDMAWVSAKQEEFVPGTGLQQIDRPALDMDALTGSLLEQLVHEIPLLHSAEEKLALLADLLKQHPYLIVIDNLETMADYQALVPLLGRLVNPGKVLLTSRHSLHAYSDVYCLSLQELNRADTLAFLKYEAEMRGLSALAGASRTQLESIRQVAGGNPLALKLVAGQIRVLPLSQVLENLKQARGKKTEDLYTYIYWQTWQALDPVSREVLLVMPLAQGGTLAQITALSEFAAGELGQALAHLAALSLVEVSGDIEQRRYRIHRLTETFLLTEIAQWPSLP